MHVSEFDYDLPTELIAQEPTADRDASRMMVVDRKTGNAVARQFGDIIDYLAPGDCLVVNDTRVIRARLHGHRQTGGAVEALLLRERECGVWNALLRPGGRLKTGECIRLKDNDWFEVRGRDADIFTIKFSTPDVLGLLDRYGTLPLPPYIDRPAEESDGERYQTVFATTVGAVAAPTAGLHFTPPILAQLEESGVHVVPITLHVGYGTFKPVAVDSVEDHRMHDEFYRLSVTSAERINATRRAGQRVVAVGTTSVRVLESCVDNAGQLQAGEGWTRLFLYPPYQPRAVDALLTNFHLPRSTLLMLVSTFATPAIIHAAYRQAIAQRFRFYSYGDCMLLT